MLTKCLARLGNICNPLGGYYTDLFSIWRTSHHHRWMLEIRLGRGASEGGRTIYLGVNLFDYLGKSISQHSSMLLWRTTTTQYGRPCRWAPTLDHIHPRLIIRGTGQRALLQAGCTAIVDDLPVVDTLPDFQYAFTLTEDTT